MHQHDSLTAVAPRKDGSHWYLNRSNYLTPR